jgi:UDPglucose 6-dehydrogenase
VPTVSVVGLGAVGWAVVHGLSRHYTCTGFDIDDDYEWDSVVRSDIVFVCVPTPPTAEGRLDCSAVRDVLSRLSRDAYGGPVVIKSTIGVGFMDKAVSEFPGLRLVYMPEFLRERSRYTWFLHPDRLVLSGHAEDIDETLRYFTWATGAAVIRTNHRSAEVAKLAHNAFIATKVSFTNEIEQVSRELGADPHEVMAVVASDRRVLSDAHLTPGLGPYGGKCVPKDTEELAIAGSPHTRLLAHIVSARKSDDRPSQPAAGVKIGVVIPTKNRAEKLSRALASIATQVRLPDEVIVVSDSSGDQDRLTREVIAGFEGDFPIHQVRNHRAANMSGAVNTGLSVLQSHQRSPTGTYVALLDDDDWWNRHYLDNVATYAMEVEADWVVSGLIRHETRDRGVPQSIPSQLSVGDFLVSNPNVQGSNLFVRFSRLLEVGGLDESLPSTTDRDLCVRLLRLPGMRYEVLRNHLVHHDASPDPSRLSTPGSERKRAGLTAFYRKHSAEMSPEQRAAFRERARKLFEVEIPSEA